MEEEEFFDSCRKSSPDVVDQWLPMNRGYRETAAVGIVLLYSVRFQEIFNRTAVRDGFFTCWYIRAFDVSFCYCIAF